MEDLLLSDARCSMPTLPLAIATIIGAFAPLVSRRVFEHAKLLIGGTILAPGKRSITSVLRVMGRSDDQHFQNDPRVLNRAQWWPLEASHRLLGLLLDAFVPDGPVVMGLDETMERRRGEQIATQGIDLDPVRSSHTHSSKPVGCAGSA
jgi:DDE superfamily endonuclease